MASQSHATSDERVASVRLTVGLHDALRRIAEAEHRTISQELRRLVERHVESWGADVTDVNPASLDDLRETCARWYALIDKRAA